MDPRNALPLAAHPTERRKPVSGPVVPASQSRRGVMPHRSRPFEDPGLGLRLALLLGQGFFYGFGLVLWYVAADTRFLVDWGAARMPWVFIGVGIAVLGRGSTIFSSPNVSPT